MILLKLILVMSASEYILASTPNIALPGCPSSCGDIHIPYPFGIGANCSLNDGFQVICEQNKEGQFKPYLHNEYFYELKNISTDNAYARVDMTVTKQCSPVGSSDQWTTTIELTGTPLYLSNTSNIFISVGCGKLAIAYSNNSQVACFSMGCTTVSNDLYGCNGIEGCCQTDIPGGISYANISFASVEFDASKVIESSSCIYAAIVESEYFYINQEGFRTKLNEKMPLILDWSIPIEKTTCSSNGYPVSRTTTNSPGHVCRCFHGYEGNPYLPEGCTDIDECSAENLETYGCPKGRTCYNILGSYSCSCPMGWKPNTNDPQGPRGACVLNGATFAGLVIAGGIVVGIALYVLIRAAVVLKEKRKIKRVGEKRKKNLTRHQEMISILQDSSHHDFTGTMTILGVEELEKATNTFDKSLIIGQGGHGLVYKGILSNQQVIAIKRPKIEDDDREIEEFLNEVLILSQLNHRNVVKLVGCCLEDEVPLLVYEFISNGTLTEHLHVEEGDQSLSWNDRLRIALETSRALSYLHSAASISVFHRDIKTSNILLTDGLVVKLSDFGASKSVQIDATGVTTVVQGTRGYLDPEYFYTGRLTEKSDVYSFGVILAELLTRKQPHSFVNMPNGVSLVAYFSTIMSESRLPEILDPQILEEKHILELESVAEIAGLCMRMKGEERPTMKEVEMRLELLWKSKLRIAQNWNEQQVEQQQALIGN